MTTMYQEPHLPQKFAENLLDCQIQFQLNQKLAPTIIIQLISLYRIGIQYYESIRSYKYLYFQRKMNSIVKSELILKNLNQKKQQVVVESLTEFKKEQIYLNQEQQSTQSPTKKKKANGNTPFKRHIEQKISEHLKQEQIKKYTIQRQRVKRYEEKKKLIDLQQKQKYTQINEKTQQLSSNNEIKKIIDIFDQKRQIFDEKVNQNLSEQEKQFARKLQERRTRVKSNTDKRRMTKSFSAVQNSSSNNKQNSQGLLDWKIQNIQNSQIDISIELKQVGKRVIPSTKMFSSFIEESNIKQKCKQQQDDYYDADFQFEQVVNPNNKQKS